MLNRPFQDGRASIDLILHPRNEAAIAWAARVESRKAAARVTARRAVRVELAERLIVR